VCQTHVPSRLAFFVWSVALGKILTLDNLRKLHVIVMDICCVCKRNGEFVDHLLLHCKVSSGMWSALCSRFGMSWVMPRRVIGLFACWWFCRNARVWKMVSTCLFWCLWRKINNTSFEDLKRTLEDILSSFFHTLYIWTTTYVSPLWTSYDDFLLRFSLSS
jgi:hypothetical protein